ncbi:hypothetical protein BAUCODRAFT_22873 [Baudoinia panamericana UAMH 10762]|uniref:Uncharacterized protein n=1 Tax=Baudoinia panamericana (strain UAMH 10762) TaxID=717646 RepID=M2N289_BAUPA|nr:uncharacterized protein BAUCODRAFT_22873 [Baudoinia panamericana UAMH 10762]EMC98023.1 hypothetical protein BAUCODRAFT_22873 [Baudoinia panamericana UAMH 10762]
MSHSGRLHGKTAIVTGAGMGLGEGITKKFVDEGANVLLFEISQEHGQKVADGLPKDKAMFYKGDVTNLEHWEAALKQCQDKWGGLDIVVNNAGVVHRAGPSNEVPRSEYDRIMSINVSPLYQSAKAIQPYFAKQKHGVYVNVSSISAPRPRPNLVWYAGSKGAVSAITKGLAAEFAKDGVRCNAICPVIADTSMVVNVLGGTDTPEGRAVVMKGIPLGRYATPRDIGNAAAFLASDEADFITGIELPVDGGRALN